MKLTLVTAEYDGPPICDVWAASMHHTSSYVLITPSNLTNTIEPFRLDDITYAILGSGLTLDLGIQQTISFV